MVPTCSLLIDSSAVGNNPARRARDRREIERWERDREIGEIASERVEERVANQI